MRAVIPTLGARDSPRRAQKQGEKPSLWMLGISGYTCSLHAHMYKCTHVPALLSLLEGMVASCTHSGQKAVWFCEAAGSFLLFSKNSDGLYFLFSCVSRVHKPHTISPPLSTAKNAVRTIESLATCGQAYTPPPSCSLHTVRLAVSSPWSPEVTVKQTPEREGLEF